jgi:hypothetical protein
MTSLTSKPAAGQRFTGDGLARHSSEIVKAA